MTEFKLTPAPTNTFNNKNMRISFCHPDPYLIHVSSLCDLVNMSSTGEPHYPDLLTCRAMLVMTTMMMMLLLLLFAGEVVQGNVGA